MPRPAIPAPSAPSRNIVLFQSSIATRSRPRPAKNTWSRRTPSTATSPTSMRCEQSRLVATRRERTRPFVPWKIRTKPATNEREQRRTVANGRDRSRPEDRYVARLEDENEFLRGQVDVKDTQIGALLERDKETNMLIHRLAGNARAACSWPPSRRKHRRMNIPPTKRRSSRRGVHSAQHGTIFAGYNNSNVWQTTARAAETSQAASADRQALHGEHAVARRRRAVLP